MDSAFGSSPLFGMPSLDPAMNVMHMQQAYQFAQNNPGNLQAQRQFAYWAEVVQRQGAAAPLPQASPPQAATQTQFVQQPQTPTFPTIPLGSTGAAGVLGSTQGTSNH